MSWSGYNHVSPPILLLLPNWVPFIPPAFFNPFPLWWFCQNLQGRPSESWLAPWLGILPLSSFLILLQSLWPTLLLSEHAGTLLLQDFCISYFLCLKRSSPRHPHGSSSYFLFWPLFKCQFSSCCCYGLNGILWGRGECGCPNTQYLRRRSDLEIGSL